MKTEFLRPFTTNHAESAVGESTRNAVEDAINLSKEHESFWEDEGEGDLERDEEAFVGPYQELIAPVYRRR